MTWPACTTCGGEIGEHYGQCPDGAQPLPMIQPGSSRIAGWVIPPQPTSIALAKRETLRLTLVDQDPEQPGLPMD